ncbi:MAG: putative glycoside hydrolase [Spirochaetia bacterium]
MFLTPLIASAVTFQSVERAGSNRLFAATEKEGVLFSGNGGKDWKNRSEGLPIKKVWPFSGDEYRGITDMSVDPRSRRRVALTTASGLYITENGGGEWKNISLGSPVSSSSFFTSVTFDPLKKGRIYLGTSSNGLFVSDNLGDSWKKLGDLLSPLSLGAGFYKEISEISVSRDDGSVYILNRFDRVLYKFEPEKGIEEEIQIPESYASLKIEGMSRYSGGAVEGPAVEFHCNDSRLVYGLKDDQWRELPPLLSKPELNKASDDNSGYEDKKGIYINAHNAYGSRLEEHLEFIKRRGFNAIVVDVKDDVGRIAYKSNLEQPRRYGAILGSYDLDELIEKAHTEDVYVIARIVVFKDDVLYEAEDRSYAVWDHHSDEPWGRMVEQENADTGEAEKVQKEYWVDPYSEEVWDYNIAVAEEVQHKGVDEIQFDYIRFPSDGDLSRIRYRHRKEGMNKTDAVESFLRKVRSTIHIPISADLYGFNSWYRMGNWIGQDIEMVSRYVDVICPMFYPSHFPRAFLPGLEYNERAYRIYLEGSGRAAEITDGRSVIRPYIQAFLIGKELSMEESEYEEYLKRQIEGTLYGGGSGYTLWNNVNRYYMVNSEVNELNEKEIEEPEKDTR